MKNWTENITIEDLKVFIGNSGIYDTLTDTNQYTTAQVKSAIVSAIEQYKFLMPCVCGEAFYNKYKNLALSHIAVIFIFNVYKNANAEQNETKTRIERDYQSLLNEFREGGLYYGFCNKLKIADANEVRPSFNISLHSVYNPIGVNDANQRRW